MSTRRTTRASSRQARSETPSVGIPESEVTATPRQRTRTRGGTPRPPPVALRASTAYGTNSIVPDASMKGPRGTEQIGDVLQDVLEPQRAGGASARNTPAPESLQNGAGRHRSEARGPFLGDDRSYHHESGIFGTAGLESSIGEFNELDAISEESVSRMNADVHQQLMNEKIERIFVQEQSQRPAVEVPAIPVIGPVERFKTIVRDIVDQVWNFMEGQEIVYWAAGIFIFGLTLVLLTSGSPFRFYGKTDLSHNIGQFIPEIIAHPLNYFNDNEVKSLRQRMSAVEYDVQHLKQQSELGSNAISHLQDILPTHVICKKDKRGALQITSEFWHALDDKLRSETDLFQSQVSKVSEKASKSTTSAKEVERIVEKKAGALWDKFLISNQAKINSWVGDEFDRKLSSKFEQSLKKSNIATKSEFLDLIRKNWADTQSEIKSEVGKLTQELDRTTHQITKLQQDAVTTSILQPIVTDILKKLIPAAQLEALSRANLNINKDYGLRRVNHFSLGTGAIVNVPVTSPTYRFPSLAMPFYKKALRWMYLPPPPAPKPPIEALTRWDEHGDCWCAPSSGTNGFGASIGVITGNFIIPDELIIEHIPPTASLEPGVAPREIELLAQITDFNTYNAVRAMSMDVFRDETGEMEHPYSYVKIAEATFDPRRGGAVQAFPVQLDLKDFGARAKADAFIVRVRNNWGGENVPYTCLYRVRLHGEVVKEAAAV